MTDARTVTVTLLHDGSMCAVPVPFDPKAVFGKVRAPVKVTLNGYTFNSTIASMGGVACIPFRRGQREHVEAIENAKMPETRARRIAKAVAMVAGRPGR